MDPGESGRLRGFRAPGAGRAGPAQPADPPQPADDAATGGAAHRQPVPDSAPDAALADNAPEPTGEVLTIGKPPTRRPRTRGTRGNRQADGAREDAAASGSNGRTADGARSEGAAETTRQPSNRQGASWRWAIVAASVLLVAMAVIATLAFKLGATTSTAPTSASSTQGAPTPSAAPPLAVTDVYELVAPSVVMITTSKGSLGSGVIVNSSGLVLTAHHVVAGGGTISVLFADGTKASAKIASSNPKSDIATLAPAELPEVVVPAVLGGGLAVGSDVVAIGNPLGLRDSTTSGIVSGLNRTTKTASGSVSGLIQFDAAVNPGSSGGPLLNTQGLVVGVVVSIADPGKDDAFAGIGFAVPIGTALAGGDGDEGPGGGPRL